MLVFSLFKGEVSVKQFGIEISKNIEFSLTRPSKGKKNINYGPSASDGLTDRSLGQKCGFNMVITLHGWTANELCVLNTAERKHH